MPNPKTLDVKSLKGFVPYKRASKTCEEMEAAIQFRHLACKGNPKIGLSLLGKRDKHFTNKD